MSPRPTHQIIPRTWKAVSYIEGPFMLTTYRRYWVAYSLIGLFTQTKEEALADLESQAATLEHQGKRVHWSAPDMFYSRETD